MSTSDTLLAYLVSSFPGNTENVATEALRHIINRSDGSKEGLNDVIQSGARGTSPIVRVTSQVMQPDGSYPDLVGYDENGEQRVLIEVKFWAELTDRQPNHYLDNLADDGPAVLIFLAPEERVRWLWPQLRNRAEKQYGALTELDSERKCARVGDTQRHLMIVSWGGLLDSMAARSSDYGESGIENEIRQLRSLAKYAETRAVEPIGDKDDWDKIERKRLFQRLIDDATERGIAEEWASRRGLNRTPRTYGYGRYIRLHEHIVWFGINANRFEKTGDTPLWLHFNYSWKNIPREASDALGMQDSEWAPVDLKRDVEYPGMLEGVVESLKHIADVLHESRSPSP